MRAFYYLFNTFLITCLVAFNTHPQTWREILGGGLAPKPLMSAAYARRPLPTDQILLKSKKLFVDGRTYGRTDGRTDPLY